MTGNKVSHYIVFHKLTKGLLTFAGLWPYENSNFFYKILPYIELIISLGIVIAIFGFVRQHFFSVSLVTRGLSIMTSFITVILKLKCISTYREDLKELHSYLDSSFSALLENSKLTKRILEKVQIFTNLSVVFTVCVLISVCFYIINPLIFIIQHHKLTVVKYPLIYPSSYPWEVPPSGFYYQLHFVFELLASWTLLLVTTGIDSLFTLYIFMMIGQLRKMSYSMTHINESEDKDFVARKCIDQYEKLLRGKSIIETLFGPIILWIIGTNAIVLCTLLFQITQMKSISMLRGILFITYFTLKIVQTFMYAWSGSCLTEESEKYRYAVYASNWYGDKRLSTTAIITMAQKPLTLTACNFGVVSVNIFVMVLNTTVSYFFLLQTLDQ
ncbi:hypothetical protein G9C98_006003 [Cotesia typhae]|uniref:Odorant receptor n=1 Tax=Cotesia typhae TaxID=2053667 RepID=A0A8J5QZQ9_9HYME|nr:hypothetical protein G9C98_006003 [Cotesia typhae]